eukprot:gnl/TRDRNA2_/TRDRNA2_170767_c0_seq1.p1 gnl/TRDRNA2_/TRDRNA2_170767_c0~~gnl/TRDRNA2_/TRDRNA2_170767_c0_seq1.p1  ORF type:complete len:278 (-),score=57.76 gnl/TRDRNA2_/TRDRNA2_170767_c0_seq1:146-979(-)
MGNITLAVKLVLVAQSVADELVRDSLVARALGQQSHSDLDDAPLLKCSICRSYKHRCGQPLAAAVSGELPWHHRRHQGPERRLGSAEAKELSSSMASAKMDNDSADDCENPAKLQRLLKLTEGLELTDHHAYFEMKRAEMAHKKMRRNKNLKKHATEAEQGNQVRQAYEVNDRLAWLAKLKESASEVKGGTPAELRSLLAGDSTFAKWQEALLNSFSSPKWQQKLDNLSKKLEKERAILMEKIPFSEKDAILNPKWSGGCMKQPPNILDIGERSDVD